MVGGAVVGGAVVGGAVIGDDKAVGSCSEVGDSFALAGAFAPAAARCAFFFFFFFFFFFCWTLTVETAPAIDASAGRINTQPGSIPCAWVKPLSVGLRTTIISPGLFRATRTGEPNCDPRDRSHKVSCGCTT